MEKERKLATIRKIKEVNSIPNADNIERAVVDGWNVVVKKGEFEEGDLCLYFEIDSLLPDWPQFEFLRSSSWKSDISKYRLRTVKLRGVISQGLALPLSSFPQLKDVNLNDDFTEVLEVEKYEPPIPTSLGGDVKGRFPSFIPKTDEERIQNVPDILSRHPHEEYVITEKLDGTSATYYFNEGEFGFCGRNWEFKPETKNTYSEIAEKYDLQIKMQNLGRNIAVQGEIVGPGIQGNKYKLKEHRFFVFNIFNINFGMYLTHPLTEDICKLLELDHVPVLDIVRFRKNTTVEDLLKLAEGRSQLHDTEREGVVIKSINNNDDIEIGRLSFKVINNKFLVKHNE